MLDDEVEPSELQEVVELVTTAKLITEVVIAAGATITAAAPQLTTVAAPILTTAPSATRRGNGVVIRDPEETATPSTIIHTEAKSKDKGKWILVEKTKPLKKQAQIEQDEAYDIELEAELNKNIDWDERMTYDDIRSIFEKKFNSNVAFLEKTKEQMEEEDSRALKRISKSQEDKESKKSSMEESKNSSWFSKGQKLEIVRVQWSAHYHIYLYTDDLLVERRYPLTRLTLDQMLNNVRLKVEEESDLSLELLRFIRRQQQEGFRPE
uniref:Uncharacterized protein n=1 Tax=Tanacetum cinerariifolium TaxID=118510 RepID=A0A6L2NBI7_TANCI|nr:hypothetical protein [Tanacetum cinerariifolium]